MRIFNSVLAIGLAISTIVDAQMYRDKLNAPPSLTTVATINLPKVPSCSIALPSQAEVNIAINHRAYQPLPPDMNDLSNDPTNSEYIDPIYNRNGNLNKANTIQGLPGHKPNVQTDHRGGPIQDLTDPQLHPRVLEILPDGPGGYYTIDRPFPSIQDFTSHPDTRIPTYTSTSTSTLDTTSRRPSAAIDPWVLPNGPAAFTHHPYHPVSLLAPPRYRHHARDRDTTATSSTLSCTGPNLRVNAHTCYAHDTEHTPTDITGSWCMANCQCTDHGNMECDSKGAAGCSAGVQKRWCLDGVQGAYTCDCVGVSGGAVEDENVAMAGTPV